MKRRRKRRRGDSAGPGECKEQHRPAQASMACGTETNGKHACKSHAPPPAARNKSIGAHIDMFFFYEAILAPTVQAMKRQFNRERMEQTVREDVLHWEIFEERQKGWGYRNLQEIAAMMDAEAMMRSQFKAPSKQHWRRVNGMRGVAKQLGRQLGLLGLNTDEI